MYAIIDIETTGGKFNEEAITEIAVYRLDQDNITDQFFSLVKADRPIQPFVIGLTGITPKMLKNAPKFHEIAKRIIEITDNCILVAHNALFDYRILRTEFKRLGYDFKRESICTVQLSKELIPGLDSYKLGKLAVNLGIPISDRHRAQGDALATLKLFELLIQKDKKKVILNSFIKEYHKSNIQSKYIKIIDQIPNKVGVYYIHDKSSIIYIGKSKNLKKRVITHLTSSGSKAMKIQNQIERISYDQTGSELIALLKEQEEIKENQPKLNIKYKNTLFPIGFRTVKDINGYLNITIEQIKNKEKYLFVFKNKFNAILKLNQWIKDYELCENLTILSNKKTTCVQYNLKKCKGACCYKESANFYNDRVSKLLNTLNFIYPTLLIIDKGRNVNEKSFIFIEDYIIRGYGYYELNHQIKTLKKIKNRLVEIDHNQDSQTILYNYIKSNKHQNLIEL
tara:strand:- start:1887 stop:3245 length:1359 start_codon:yes stop_codon:yes gene_type:complete